MATKRKRQRERGKGSRRLGTGCRQRRETRGWEGSPFSASGGVRAGSSHTPSSAARRLAAPAPREVLPGQGCRCHREVSALGLRGVKMPGGESYPLALHSLSPRGRRYRAHQLGGTLDEGRVRYLCGRWRERTKALALRHVFPLGD